MKIRLNKKEKQLSFKIKSWGGNRRGAGRPNNSKTVNHMKREKVTLKTPLHMTLRLKREIPSIRKKDLLKEFERGIALAKKQSLFVIHFSIENNHIHLYAEATSNLALARGMRSLAGRFAKVIRQFAHKQGCPKKGSVFVGRYHLHILKTIREARNALEYVLLNHSKHQKLIEYVDEFSSGKVFKHWPQLLGKRLTHLIRYDWEFYRDQHFPLAQILSPPQSWLATTGWMRA